MGRFYIGILSLVIITFFTECKKSQTVPSYVYIPSIEVNSNYGISGSSSSKITSAKVFSGNKLIGVYELPINVPVLEKGQVQIQCLAVIENYGAASNLTDYIFYNSTSNDVFLEDGSQDTIYPIATYNPASNTDYWFEDFNGASHAFLAGEDNNATFDININPNEIYEGTGSGSFELPFDSSYAKFLTDEGFFYPSGRPAYIELDYKNNQAFFFSLILNPGSGPSSKLPVFQFSNTELIDGEPSWNKIYIEVGSLLNNYNNLASFDICFEMPRNSAVSDPIVMVDNVKVIVKK